eukprot:6217603-Ditylum_brightwellii.AAC.1
MLWGDVKCIKTRKRSHIQDESLKKQLDPHSSEQHILFDELDIKFDKVLESWATEIEQQASELISQRTKILCLFHAWVEPWEQELLFKPTNHVAEAKYLNKYGWLKWLGPDNGDCICAAALD